MILFLPINIYRARYQVGAGRPYSAFERLLLEAVAAGNTTTEKLASLFCVHERLVIEGVATLLEAGWTALDAQNQLFATSVGKQALQEERLPPNMVLRPCNESVVQERICGQLVLHEAVTYARRQDLEKEQVWHHGLALPPSAAVPTSIDPGQIVPLLHVGDSAYLHWVGPVDIHRSDEDYLVVTVNPDTGAIANLPRAWEPALRTHLVSYARYFQDEISAQGKSGPDERWTAEYGVAEEVETTPAVWKVGKDSIRFVSGQAEHLDLLATALGHDNGYIFAASATLHDGAILQLASLFDSALRRGTSVDVLWGRSEQTEAHKRALDVFKKLEHDSARQGSGGRLRVNEAPSGCHANILVCARPSPDGLEVKAAFGSHRWLGDRGDGDARSLSLLLSHPGVVAYLSRLMADFASRDAKLSAGSAPIRLPNMAAELERRLMNPLADEYDDPVRKAAERPRKQLVATAQEPVLRVWLERQQRAALVRLANAAKHRLLIASPSLEGPSALDELDLIRYTNREITLDVRYARATWTQPEEGAISERTKKGGGSIMAAPRLQTSLLLADADHFVLSSHSWLTSFSKVEMSMSSTIGIEVEGVPSEERILSWILPGE